MPSLVKHASWVLRIFFALLLSCKGTPEVLPSSRNVSNLRLMVYPYSHFRPAEPYTYPGPSPPVRILPKLAEPYPFISSRPMNLLDHDNIPKWCKTMWERDECGMKCWMLRKICHNMAVQMEDVESSPSVAHAMFNAIPYYGPYKKPVPTITYTKSNSPNMYYAQPSWQYSYHKRPSIFRYSPSANTEFGLNPQFTYVDDQKKINFETTTVKNTETTTTEMGPTTTEKPESSTQGESATIAKPTRLKGTYPVKVTTIYRYPEDAEVTTLSPHMFDYDHSGNKRYYGDRIYMSATMPVSERQQRVDTEFDEPEFDELDEMMFDP